MELSASVVIPTYNSQKTLRLCLQSLFQQTANPADYEIVVVDDGSTDETPRVLEELTKKAPCTFRYFRQDNAGRSRARNAGIRNARGRIIILLDSDMVVRSEFIAAHMARHTQPGLVVNGPVINISKYADPNQGPARRRDFSQAFFATGNVSVERAKLLEAGLFDEEFVKYGWEDLELGRRLRRLGLKRVTEPAAWSYHIQPPLTWERIPDLIQKEKDRGESAALFFRKNPSRQVRMTILHSPVFFAWDRILTPFNWTEQPNTLKIMKFLDQAGCKALFHLLWAIVRYHAYMSGLKEALAKSVYDKE